MNCRIKICGVTTVADAFAVASLGVDAIGLNFYAKSPRCVDEAVSREILSALPARVKPIMLAVDEDWAVTLARFDRLPGVQAVQVHHRNLTPCPIATCAWIPAFSVKDETSLAAIAAFLQSCRGGMPEAILVDAHVPGSFGGTGQTLPWQLLAGFDPGVPLILAGGLTAENVEAAVRQVRPFMVDVASGVEAAPGKKDAAKMTRFVAAVRAAEASSPAATKQPDC